LQVASGGLILDGCAGRAGTPAGPRSRSRIRSRPRRLRKGEPPDPVTNAIDQVVDATDQVVDAIGPGHGRDHPGGWRDRPGRLRPDTAWDADLHDWSNPWALGCLLGGGAPRSPGRQTAPS